MEKLLCVLDSFVYTLKENPEFSDVRFIHSGRNKFAEKPVESFLVACGVQSESILPSKGVCGKLKFVVYAPSGEGERRLTQLCERLARNIKDADKDRIIEEVNLESASFDSNLTVWCRRISVLVGLYEITEEEQQKEDVFLSIGSEDIFGVTAFSALCNKDYHVVRELLCGDTGERTISRESYVLSLTVRGAEDILEPYKDTGFTLLCKKTNEEYRGCVVEKSVLKFGASHPFREYDILCTKGVRKVG